MMPGGLYIKAGVTIYRCRLCGKEFDGDMLPELRSGLNCIMWDHPFPRTWITRPSMTIVHHCGNLKMGVADLIGGKENG